jgi:hypothetical protein
VLPADHERLGGDLGKHLLDAMLEHRSQVRDEPARTGLRIGHEAEAERFRVHEGDVLEKAHRLQHERPLPRVHARPDEHEPVDELRMPRRRLGDHLRAGGVSDEHRPVDALGHEELAEQLAGLGHAERLARLRGIAEAGQVERVDGARRLEDVGDGVPVLVRHAEPVHEHVVGTAGHARLVDHHHVLAAAELTGRRHDRSL